MTTDSQPAGARALFWKLPLPARALSVAWALFLSVLLATRLCQAVSASLAALGEADYQPDPAEVATVLPEWVDRLEVTPPKRYTVDRVPEQHWTAYTLVGAVSLDDRLICGSRLLKALRVSVEPTGGRLPNASELAALTRHLASEPHNRTVVYYYVSDAQAKGDPWAWAELTRGEPIAVYVDEQAARRGAPVAEAAMATSL